MKCTRMELKGMLKKTIAEQFFPNGSSSDYWIEFILSVNEHYALSIFRLVMVSEPARGLSLKKVMVSFLSFKASV